MKLLKILAGVVGSLLVLGVGAAVVTPMVVDPNDYKPRITALAKEHTGRELTIGGDIKLSVFPWLGVRLEQVSLGNAPGFTPPSFAELDAMHVRVKLMPLLSREIEMDTVEVDGLRLQLARNDQGLTSTELLDRLNDRLVEIDRVAENLLVGMGSMGSLSQRLKTSAERVEGLEVQVQGLLSEERDTDFSVVAIELAQASNNLQLAQASGARLIQTTLLNFLN